ncbi:cytidylate kinase-like family protein [Deferribacter autotrophicus]|uniref:Cytidylate kinase-like family protein n=1 Tax=Deferribacter autotrophicus TaxID=500465 RepID=A0A5A8F3Y1_9BACT|nr:cytidylate kinase-like family protein [Deferribacter autotrophicus]KAA0258079.1 cytidylate kinase-like family protein [Deferribacter autotrophicus]
MAVITISREYGCSGEFVAARLSKQLNYKYINKELIEYIAILTGVPKEVVEKYDEEMHSNFKAFISKYFDLDMFKDIFEKVEEAEKEIKILDDDQDLFGDRFSASHVIDSEIFHSMVERLITKLADEDNVVILGRGSQCILQNFEKAYHFRLYADIEDRIKWVSKSENISENDARKKIMEIDKRKRNFVEHYYDKNIDDKNLYHLLINMSKVSIDGAVEIISHIVR